MIPRKWPGKCVCLSEFNILPIYVVIYETQYWINRNKNNIYCVLNSSPLLNNTVSVILLVYVILRLLDENGLKGQCWMIKNWTQDNKFQGNSRKMWIFVIQWYWWRERLCLPGSHFLDTIHVKQSTYILCLTTNIKSMEPADCYVIVSYLFFSSPKISSLWSRRLVKLHQHAWIIHKHMFKTFSLQFKRATECSK